MKKTIAVITAHADDIELTAGGTLAKYIDLGYRALYGVLSRCNSGWSVTEEGGRYIPSLEIVPQRRAEAEAAAKTFGAEFYMGDLLENYYTSRDGSDLTPSFTGALEGRPDDDVPAGMPLVVAAGAGNSPPPPALNEVTDLLVAWEPELVIGQAFQNMNIDHFGAALIVAKAWLAACEKVEIGPYWVPVLGKGFARPKFPPLEPDAFVDVTGYEETCLAALACHRSQGMHLPGPQGRRRKRWAAWGKVHGCTSAEAFLRVFPHI